jgi:hypothetical protein
MNILKNILSESKEHYLNVKMKIEKKLAGLPKGSAKERKISGRQYYYLQYRSGKKIIHKYLGRNKPEQILKQTQERKKLKAELKKVNEALELLRRTEGKKRD